MCLQLPSLVPTFISSKVSVFLFAATKFGSDINFRQRFVCLCLQLPILVPKLISSKVSVFLFAATRCGSDNSFVKGFCVYVSSYIVLIGQMSSKRYMMFTLIPAGCSFTGFASAADICSSIFIDLHRFYRFSMMFIDFIDFH